VLPVERGVSAVEDIEIHLAERALRFDDQPTDAAIAAARRVHLHRLAIGEQRMAFLDCRLLLAKEEFRRAQLERIVAAIEDVAQDDVRHLLDEKGRRVHRAFERARVAGLHRTSSKQLVAQLEHHLVVVPRIRIADCLQFAACDAPARLCHQRGMEAALGIVGLLDRMDFGPQVIGAQEVVRDAQPSGRVST
jgi:hypothetical protein